MNIKYDRACCGKLYPIDKGPHTNQKNVSVTLKPK